MVRQQVGDLLEVEYEGKFYYIVVLTKVVMFGGNIVFAFHTDGTQQQLDSLLPLADGFNICTDLLLPKREETVRRLSKIEDTAPFWRTKLFKQTMTRVPGAKAIEWFIFEVEAPTDCIARISEMPKKCREAMDYGTSSFDLTAKKILSRYTPDQNEHL